MEGAHIRATWWVLLCYRSISGSYVSSQFMCWYKSAPLTRLVPALPLAPCSPLTGMALSASQGLSRWHHGRPHLQPLGCKDGAKAHPHTGCEPSLSQGPEHRLLGPAHCRPLPHSATHLSIQPAGHSHAQPQSQSLEKMLDICSASRWGGGRDRPAAIRMTLHQAGRVLGRRWPGRLHGLALSFLTASPQGRGLAQPPLLPTSLEAEWTG